MTDSITQPTAGAADTDPKQAEQTTTIHASAAQGIPKPGGCFPIARTCNSPSRECLRHHRI